MRIIRSFGCHTNTSVVRSDGTSVVSLASRLSIQIRCVSRPAGAKGSGRGGLLKGDAVVRPSLRECAVS